MTAISPEPAKARYLPYDLLQWRPVDPASPHRPHMAVLWGNPGLGDFGARLRVPAGCESPMHTHTRDEQVVQLRGQSIHWTPSENRSSAPTTKPGDYMIMPGSVPRVSATPEGEESLEFITTNRPFESPSPPPKPR